MLDASLISLNIRYLLWKKGTVRGEWIGTLADLLHWDGARAEGLLAGETADLNDEELMILAGFGGISEGEFASLNLLEMSGVDIFHENLAFLVDLIPHGEKKHFAAKIGVDPTTISRWKNGSQHPTRKNLSAILEYFNLSRDADLMAEPVFLYQPPVGAVEIRKWLNGQIDKMERNALYNILPALKKLLRKK